MPPRTRQSSHGKPRGLLESMEDVSNARQSKKWGHASRHKARMQKSKALAMSTRRDLRLSSIAGSDPADPEELEDASPSIVDSSDDLDDRSSPRGPSVTTRSRFRSSELAKPNRVTKRRSPAQKKKEQWTRAAQRFASELSQGSDEEAPVGMQTRRCTAQLKSQQSEYSDIDEELYNDIDAISTSEASQDEFELERQEEVHIINDVLDSGELDFVSIDDLFPAPAGYSLVDVAGYNLDNFIDWTGNQDEEEDDDGAKRVSDWLQASDKTEPQLPEFTFEFAPSLDLMDNALHLDASLLAASAHLDVPNDPLRAASPAPSEITEVAMFERFGDCTPMVITPLQLHGRIKELSLCRNPNNPKDPFRWPVKHKSKKKALFGQIRSMYGKKEMTEYTKRVREARKQALESKTDMSCFASEPLPIVPLPPTSRSSYGPWTQDAGYGSRLKKAEPQLSSKTSHVEGDLELPSSSLGGPLDGDLPVPGVTVHEDWVGQSLAI